MGGDNPPFFIFNNRMKRWGHLQNTQRYFLPGEKNKKTTLSVEDREQLIAKALKEVYDGQKIEGFSVLIGASGTTPPPVETYYILAENTDPLITESSDNLITEQV